ncbi:site-specific recombinase XerD [Maribacter spongiicola]|uniref:Site-specific recombinase XerD n=1 Tax=Maribacter spongiicola TaxID=1206753 RepID=A0A4R7K6L4_9FLAO|nr:site-specific integrase [Maribacter spongiicola]TDT46916.1 site-specific recombinase XerD [Maribacter spongiicola]
MQVTFHLRKDKIGKGGLAPIRMVVASNGFKIFKAVKNVKSSVSSWDKKKERLRSPKANEAYNNHIEYNKIIDDLESKLKTLNRYILLNEIVPDKAYILDKLNSDSKMELTHSFIPSFNEFIELGKLTKAERTVKSYTTAKNFFENFEKSTGYSLRFESITNEFFEKFQEYCFTVKNTKNNYFARLVTTLKTFMKWSLERDYHSNISFLKFKAPEEEIEVIYLTYEELMSLYNFEFDNESFSRIRDMYCFACFTGLRFSDIRNLKASNVYENEIKINIQKTKTVDHTIPLNSFAKAILAKYKDTLYEPLPVISSQGFNKKIKKVCEKVKINTPTTTTRFVGSRKVEHTLPKWKLITSHTARKTFVTNSLILGMKIPVLKSITGHKKEQSFRRYVNISESLKRSEMDSTWDKK